MPRVMYEDHRVYDVYTVVLDIARIYIYTERITCRS